MLKEIMDLKYNLDELCEIIEQYTTYDGNSLVELCNEDLLMFLSSLAIADDVVVMDEINYINELLDSSYNLLEIKKKGRGIDLSGYVVPAIIEKAVEYDLASEESNASQIILNSFYYIGVEFIACDEDIAASEIQVLTELITNYQMYIKDAGLDFEMMDIVGDLHDRKYVKTQGDMQVVNVKEKEPEKVEIPSYDEKFTALLNELNDKRFEKVRNSLVNLINNIRIRNLRKQRGLKTGNISKTMLLFGGDEKEIEAISKLLAELFSIDGITNENYVTRFMCSSNVNSSERIGKALDMTKSGNMLILKADDLSKEEIDRILESMKENEHQVVLLSGDTNRLISFMEKNRQMNPKFNRSLYLDGINGELICDIFEYLCVENDYRLSSGAKAVLLKFFDKNQYKFDPYYLFEIFDRVVEKHNQRILKETDLDSDKMIKISREDLLGGLV